VRGLVVFALVMAAGPAARAQNLADALGDPSPVPNLVVSTPYGSDRIELTRIGDRAIERCHAPCALSIEPGRWHIRFERAGQSTEFDLGDETLVVRGVPLDTIELGLGIGLAAAGAIVLAVLGALHEEFCLDLDGSCRFGEGFLMLGVGSMSVLVGIGLSIDSIGGVELMPLPR
jgi:hypothetical protein